MLTCIHCFLRVLGRSSFTLNLENKEALCKWIPLPFPPTLDYNRTLSESFPQPTEVATMKIPIFREENWDTERLSNLPLITQFVSGRDGSPNRAILLPDPPDAPSSHVQTTVYVNCWISVARCTWKKDWVETKLIIKVISSNVYCMHSLELGGDPFKGNELQSIQIVI